MSVKSRWVKRLICFIVFILTASCSSESNRESKETQEQTAILLDSLRVRVVLDATPGFKYPRMYHEFHFVGHLNIPGVIDIFAYKSGSIDYGAQLDFFGARPKGVKYRHSDRIWSSDLADVGSEVPYSFRVSAHSKGRKIRNLTIDSIAVVEKNTDGPRPFAKSKQLTGPDYFCGSPLYSQNGKWLYYKEYKRESHRVRIVRLSTENDFHESIVECNRGDLGGYTLAGRDTKLVYAVNKWKQKSKLVIKDLLTGKNRKLSFNGFFRDSKLIHIPTTQKYLCLSAENAARMHGDLVLVDAANVSIDVLVSDGSAGHILFYNAGPGTKEIYYGVQLSKRPFGSWTIVKRMDLRSRHVETFIREFHGTELVWAPNGRDFAFIRDGNIYLNESGKERRITTYPGRDRSLSFAPDGSRIVFASNRRHEYQVWQVVL